MFRFTIRDVLWLTVVVALVVGWSVSYVRAANLNRELRESLKEVGMAMQAHGFMMQVDMQTGEASWSFGGYYPRP
jgi:hypothetical protein